jgi:hypothetical protein
LVAERRIERALKALGERGAPELTPADLDRLALSQKAFEQLRDQYCRFKGAADLNSRALVGEMFGYCIRRMNQERAKELESMLRLGPATPFAIPGDTAEERARFLAHLSSADPNRSEYFGLGLRSDDAAVRRTAAYLLSGHLWENIPILLYLITTDPNGEVRQSAALNLSCQFTCNGSGYALEDVLVLERDMPLLRAAITDPFAGRYVVEMLDSLWCDLTDKARAEVTSILASALPLGEDTIGSDESAKSVLTRRANEACSPGEPVEKVVAPE